MNKQETDETVQLLINAAKKCAQKGTLEADLRLFYLDDVSVNELDLRDFETVISDYKHAFTLAEKALNYLVQYRKQAGTLELASQ